VQTTSLLEINQSSFDNYSCVGYNVDQIGVKTKFSIGLLGEEIDM
jgi:hypothetical protein